ncbi:MAG: hypothetical protein ACRDU8_02175 [Egibacteraceae bacterium]
MPVDDALLRHWPLFGLRLRCGDVELHVSTDPELAVLAELASAGIHVPANMPFLVPWTDAPPGEQKRNTLQYHWRHRADWSAERAPRAGRWTSRCTAGNAGPSDASACPPTTGARSPGRP